MSHNGDNLTNHEKLTLHQTKTTERLLNQLIKQVDELTKAVTAANVIDRLSNLTSRPPSTQAIIDGSEDWRDL
ncbi:hypothetical protein N8Z24_00410 [bacterium]|nr:hypothetical protein [bacterium]